MKNLFMAAFVFALAFTLAPPASAQTNYDRYWGIGIGSTDADLCVTRTSACDDQAAGAKVFFGQDIGERLDFEVGYAYHGETNYSIGSAGFKFSMGSAYGAAVGKFQVGERVELFGKAGAHFWFFQAAGGGSMSGSDDDTGFGLHYGAGADFAVDERNSFRLEYEVFLAEPEIAVNQTAVRGDYDISRFNLAYIRRF